MAIWQDTENCWPHSYFSSTSEVVLRIIIYIVTFSLLRVNIVPLHIKRKNLAIAFSQHYASIIVCTTFTHDINITMECYNFHLHSHMYFKEIGENKYTYQHYFPLLVLFTPPQIQVSIWHHFPSACGTPSAFLVVQVCWQQSLIFIYVMLFSLSKCWLFNFFLLWSFSSAFREP